MQWLQIEEHRMKEAEVELEGVTWQPQISRMAKALKRPGDEERWNYLARTAIHKNKVRQPFVNLRHFLSLLRNYCPWSGITSLLAAGSEYCSPTDQVS